MEDSGIVIRKEEKDLRSCKKNGAFYISECYQTATY